MSTPTASDVPTQALIEAEAHPPLEYWNRLLAETQMNFTQEFTLVQAEAASVVATPGKPDRLDL